MFLLLLLLLKKNSHKNRLLTLETVFKRDLHLVWTPWGLAQTAALQRGLCLEGLLCSCKNLFFKQFLWRYNMTRHGNQRLTHFGEIFIDSPFPTLPSSKVTRIPEVSVSTCEVWCPRPTSFFDIFIFKRAELVLTVCAEFTFHTYLDKTS